MTVTVPLRGRYIHTDLLGIGQVQEAPADAAWHIRA